MPAAKTQIVMILRNGVSLRTAVFPNMGTATREAIAAFKGVVPAVYNRGMMYEAEGLTINLAEVTGSEIVEVV